jgi:pullulanase/glycogen debranching enzyme
LNWFLWDKVSENAAFARFHRLLIKFRNENPLLTRKEFLTEKDVEWHGLLPFKANWSPENRFLAWTLTDNVKSEPLYIAFNAHFQPANVQLPSPPKGKKWFRIIDTSLASPNDFCEQPQSNPPLKFTYLMPDHSVLVARAL